MYMGHLGIGLGARRLSSRLPLWLLLVASVSPDLADAFSAFTPWGASVNHYSHSVYGILVLAVALGLVGGVISRSGLGALIAAAIVVSHLLADWITSRIPLWPGGPAIGWSLYRHPVGDFLVEIGVILGGLYSYKQSLGLPRGRRMWLVVAMFVCLVGFQIIWDGMLLRS